MKKVELNVSLLSYTQNALDLVYAACRQCYSGQSALEALNSPVSDEKKAALVRKVLSSGHMSPVEHISLTFGVEGISRSCSHQLVRHRLASYSQQSQRYVGLSDLPYIVPPNIEGNPRANQVFNEAIGQIERAYCKIMGLLESSDGKSEKTKEDARFLLPNACETKIVITMNARELMHFFSVRCCSRAQWEVRAMANEMLRLAKSVMPVIFEKAGAKCEQLGYCPEGEFSCGRYPVLKALLRKDGV